MSKYNFSDMDIMALFRLACEIANADGDMGDDEIEVITNSIPVAPDMTATRWERLVGAAMKMDLQDAMDTIGELDAEGKQYASNLFAQVALANGEVSDEEDEMYNNILETCGLPFTTVGNDNDMSSQKEFSDRETIAIIAANDFIWHNSQAELTVMQTFIEQNSIQLNNLPPHAAEEMKWEELVSIIDGMNDDKKEKVAQLFADVIMAKDHEDKLLFTEQNIRNFYLLLQLTSLDDKFSGEILNYKSDSEGGTLPQDMYFNLRDIYAVWLWIYNHSILIDDLPDYDELDDFLDAFYINNGIMQKLHGCDYCPFKDVDLDDLTDGFDEISKDYISQLLAGFISQSDDVLNAEEANDDYGSLVTIADMPDYIYGQKDQKSAVTKAKIEPDVFVNGMSKTKITVNIDVFGYKDDELRLVAGVFYADDNTPVPDVPGFGWWFDSDEVAKYYNCDVLAVVDTLWPSYDSSSYNNLELFIPNDVLPKERDYYIKVFLFSYDEDNQYWTIINKTSCEFKYPFKATKNVWDPDEAELKPTYIQLTYDAKKYHYWFELIPGSSYTPCLVKFVTIPLGKELKDVVKAESICRVVDKNLTAELERLSESLSTLPPDMKLSILYVTDGDYIDNPLGKLAGNVFTDTMIVAMLDDEGCNYGFTNKKQLREVMAALDNWTGGKMASAKPLLNPSAKKLAARRFWDELQTELQYHLEYEQKLSRDAKKISNKSISIKSATINNNHIVNGVRYTRLTLSFSIYGCENQECTCECTVRTKSGGGIHCNELNYCGLYENLSVHRDFKPMYDATIFKEFVFDIPNRLLNNMSNCHFELNFFTLPTFTPIETQTNNKFNLN